MIKDGPKNLAIVVAVGVIGVSYDAAPPSLIQKQKSTFLGLFLDILQHIGIVGWSSKDLKLLWSMRGEVKF